VRVVHLSLVDGVASYRLHTGLRRLGVDSTMFVARRRRDDPTVTVFQPPMSVASRLRRRFRRMRITREFARYRAARVFELFTDDRTVHGGDMFAQLPSCDVINVHTLLGVVDYRAFFEAVPRDTLVVRTLHDINFFTGGCHQDAGCGRYTERCGACPQLGSSKERDLSRRIWERKRDALRMVAPGRLCFVAPSRWVANEAKRSTLLREFPVTVIPLGLDTEIFRPLDRGLARELLGISPDASVVLFVAEPITRVNKGFAVLARALEGLDRVSSLLLLSAGSGKPPSALGVPHMHLGHVGDERMLALVYSAADVFVLPSAEENFPQTALEALACGTPVVASAVGGIPEIVRPGITGLLIPPQDVAALREAVGDLLQAPARRARMAADCRRIALQEYTLEVQAQRYVDLYGTMLARARGLEAQPTMETSLVRGN